jgi:hypothetical protein
MERCEFSSVLPVSLFDRNALGRSSCEVRSIQSFLFCYVHVVHGSVTARATSLLPDDPANRIGSRISYSPVNGY